jgi:arylsulfatase A-like enzyme
VLKPVANPSLMEFSQLIRSELFLLIGLLCIGRLLLPYRPLSSHGTRMRWIGWQGLCLVIGLTHALTHALFEIRGVVPSLTFFRTMVGSLDTTIAILVTRFTVFDGVIAISVIGAFLVIPWMLVVFEDETPPSEPPSRTLVRPVLWAVAALACFGIAWLPLAGKSYSDSFGRAPTLQLLTEALQPAQKTSPSGEPDLPKQVRETQPDLDSSPVSLEVEPTSSSRRMNIVFVTLEGVRHSATTLSDKHNPTTPNLAQLAEQGIVFEHLYARVVRSVHAQMAMLCGIPPPVRMNYRAVHMQVSLSRCLPDALEALGYRTAHFTSWHEDFEAQRKLARGFGFDEAFMAEDLDVSGFEAISKFGYEDDATLPAFDRWLNHLGPDEPFFASFELLATHWPYSTPSEFTPSYDPDDLKIPSQVPREHRSLFRKYARALNYVDRHLGKLVEIVQQHDRYDNTLFVLIGDHGQAFGEHGRVVHDNVPYEESVHVAGLAYSPDLPDHLQGRHVSTTASQLDIPPTIADLLGVTLQTNSLPGVSLLSPHPGRTVVFNCWNPDTCVGAVQWPWKRVERNNSQHPELYHLGRDPGETKNLYDTRPDIASELRRTMETWRRRRKQYYR